MARIMSGQEADSPAGAGGAGAGSGGSEKKVAGEGVELRDFERGRSVQFSGQFSGRRLTMNPRSVRGRPEDRPTSRADILIAEGRSKHPQPAVGGTVGGVGEEKMGTTGEKAASAGASTGAARRRMARPAGPVEMVNPFTGEVYMSNGRRGGDAREDGQGGDAEEEKVVAVVDRRERAASLIRRRPSKLRQSGAGISSDIDGAGVENDEQSMAGALERQKEGASDAGNVGDAGVAGDAQTPQAYVYAGAKDNGGMKRQLSNTVRRPSINFL